MSNLGPQQQNTSYVGVLQVPGGITAELQQVQDGAGNGTGLFLSSSGSNQTTSSSYVASSNGIAYSGAVPRLISDGLGDFISAKDFGLTNDFTTNLPSCVGKSGTLFYATGRSAKNDGGQGTFIFDSSDLSAYVSVDTQKGIYIAPSTDTTGASGAWIRLVEDGTWYADWFGVPDDPAAGNGGASQVASNTQMSAMINLGNILKPTSIIFSSKIYTFTSAIPDFNWFVQLVGVRGAQSTIFVKRYVEASSVRGVFAFNDYGFNLESIAVRATSGSGGSGISAILTKPSPANGRASLVNSVVSCGNYCNYSLYVDGSSNSTTVDPTAPCYRGITIRGGEYFGAAIASIAMNGVNHVFANGVFAATSGGSGSTVLSITGGTTLPNDDIQWQGVIAGVVSLNYVSRSVFVSPQTDNITVDANTVSSMWVGPRSSGILTNNAGSGFLFAYNNMIVASGGNTASGWEKLGNGEIRQWGSVSTSGGVSSNANYPVAFTSSDINITPNAFTDAGTNIITTCQIIPVAGNTQYYAKAYNFNYVVGTYAGAGTTVRWFANGV